MSGAAASRALALAGSVVVARLVGREVFGELGVIQSTMSTFTTFATFGMGLTATKHVAEYRLSDPRSAGRIIGMSSLIAWVAGSAMALGIVVMAPYIATRALAAPHLGGLLRVAAIFLLFSVVNEAQIGALSGLEAFRRRSVVQFLGGLAGLALNILLVYRWGLGGAVWSLALSQGLLVFLNFRGLRREARSAGMRITWAISSRELRVLWGFSVPTILGASLYVPAMWAANLILVNQPTGYSEMGVFSAADRWRSAILFLPMLIGGVALPILSSLRGADRGGYYRVLWSNVGISSSLSLLVAVPVACLAPLIMSGYGRGFAQGGAVLGILCAASALTATSWIIGQAVISEGRMWFMFILNAAWATALVCCTWLLRSRGAVALSVAYLVAEFLRLVMVCVDARIRQLGSGFTAPGRCGDVGARE